MRFDVLNPLMLLSTCSPPFSYVYRPAALHSLGCSAEEIASAMQRRRDAESQEKALNDEREKTERAELKARAKLAANPPPVQATSTSKAPAAPKAAAPKPQSDTD